MKVLERFFHLVDVFRGILDVVLGSESQQVCSGYILELPPYGEFVTPFRGCRCLQDEAEVVSRRKMPGTILLHDEGEILGVVIRIVGQDVEHHPEEELVQFILGDGELPAGGEEILVAICLRIDSGKCLGEHLLTGTAVKPLCQEMADTFHLDQAGRHHRNSGPGGQVIEVGGAIPTGKFNGEDAALPSNHHACRFCGQGFLSPEGLQ